MVEFKNPSIKVRCLECKENNFIKMKHIGTDKFQRTIGTEHEHLFRGELKCSHCNEEMRLLTTIFEYPEGFLNYHDVDSQSCLVIDDITEDSLSVEMNQHDSESCTKCSTEGGCPFSFTDQSELIQNYGCLPTPHQIIGMRVNHGKTWACHSNPTKPCLGAINYLKAKSLPFEVIDNKLVTEDDDWSIYDSINKL